MGKESCFLSGGPAPPEVWFWVPGIPQGLVCSNLAGKSSPLSSGPRAESVQGLVGDNQKRATAGYSFWAQPSADYTLGTGQSPISVCKLEQDLGFEKDRWCFPGLTLGPRHHQALLDHPGLSQLWRLSGCIRKRPQAITLPSHQGFLQGRICTHLNHCRNMASETIVFTSILQNKLASFPENYESQRESFQTWGTEQGYRRTRAAWYVLVKPPDFES